MKFKNSCSFGLSKTLLTFRFFSKLVKNFIKHGCQKNHKKLCQIVKNRDLASFLHCKLKKWIANCVRLRFSTLYAKFCCLVRKISRLWCQFDNKCEEFCGILTNFFSFQNFNESPQFRCEKVLKPVNLLTFQIRRHYQRKNLNKTQPWKRHITFVKVFKERCRKLTSKIAFLKSWDKRMPPSIGPVIFPFYIKNQTQNLPF